MPLVNENWGHLTVLPLNMLLVNETLGFKDTNVNGHFLKSQQVCCPDGWVGRLVGGERKSTSIFLIFKYVNKQDILILNMFDKKLTPFF